MRFKKLRISGFKKIEEQEYDFASAINVLMGSNEAGKSTIKLAILRVLFKKSNAMGKEIDILKTWRQERKPKLTLTFDCNGNNWELIKDYENKTSILTDGKNKIEDVNKVQSKIGELLGIGTEELFKATAYIDHVSVAEITSGKKEIKDSLGASFTGAGEGINAQEVLKKLKKAKDEKEKGLLRFAVNPGKIKVLRDEIGELEGELREKKEQVDNLERCTKTMGELRHELMQKKKDYEEKKKVYELNADQREKEDKLKDFKKQFDEIEAQVENYKINKNKSGLIKEELSKSKIVDKNEIIKEIFKNENMLAACNMAISQKGNQQNGVKKIGRGFEWAAIIAGIILVIAGGFIANMAIKLMAILAGMAILYGTLKLIKRNLRVEGVCKEIERNQDDAKKITETMRQELAVVQASSVDELRSLIEREKSLLNEKKAIESLLNEEIDNNLENKKREISINITSLTSDLKKPEYGSVNLSPQKYIRLKSELNELDKKIKDLERRELKGSGVIEGINVSEEEISTIEEEIEEKRAQLKNEEKRLAIIVLLLNKINEAYQSSLVPAKSIIKEKIGEYFSSITCGKYDRVEMNEDTLEFSVFSPEKGDWVSVRPEDGELSHGTIDQLFLSVRLALVDIISKDRKPPILLDDPFITYDDERLQKTMLTLKEIAKDRQIIIFTCKDIYNEFADRVILIGNRDV